jgi:hypothetical protein
MRAVEEASRVSYDPSRCHWTEKNKALIKQGWFLREGSGGVGRKMDAYWLECPEKPTSTKSFCTAHQMRADQIASGSIAPGTQEQFAKLINGGGDGRTCNNRPFNCVEKAQG